MKDFGITLIDGELDSGISKHTYKDFGMIMTDHVIPKPKVVLHKIEIPYSSGSIDLTDAIGEPTYQDREGLEFVFQVKDGGVDNCEKIVTSLSAFIHGKKLLMITDAEPSFFYIVRLEVSYEKSALNYSRITLSGTAEPFKYSRYASGSDWLWDPFSFVDGVISTLSDVVVTGSRVVPLTPVEFYTVPEFNVKTANDLKVLWNGKEYSLQVGKNYFPQIRIKGTNNVLSFTGNGTMDIDFRGRYL